ncbi:hypothetical protein D0N36_11715 [Hymenobacter lapidiphilus]|uniref:hypothetical protein n=1 Tax=Hymenobacter sp. CCM 8763 TaxID=2303334 RepID=UPI000E353564|nr:hypothetical protein [Hymenobacter sp. CCM 8763]RFP64843.1 hypothetical protein D0N36_11715 [Hymenobacter sp. CCM 8763]
MEAYAAALPFVEGGIGLLLLGLFTRPAPVAAMLVMMRLVMGSSLLARHNRWCLARRRSHLEPIQLRETGPGLPPR